MLGCCTHLQLEQGGICPVCPPNKLIVASKLYNATLLQDCMPHLFSSIASRLTNLDMKCIMPASQAWRLM